MPVPAGSGGLSLIVDFEDITPGSLMNAWAVEANTRLSALRDALNDVIVAVAGGSIDDATALAAALGIAGVTKLVVAQQPDAGGILLVGADDTGIVNDFLAVDKDGAPKYWGKNAGGWGVNDWLYTQKNLSREPNNLLDIYGNRRQNGTVEFTWSGPPGNMLSYGNACHEHFDTDRAGSRGDWTVVFGSAGVSYAESSAPVPTENGVEFTANTTSMEIVTGTGVLAYPAVAGGTYSSVHYLKAVATARSPQGGMQFFKSDGTFISELFGSTTATNTSTFTKVTSGALTAPALTAFACPAVKWPTTVNGEKHRLCGAAMFSLSTTSWSPPAASQPWPTFGSAIAGDRWWRTDTPSTANQRLYICTTGGLPHQQVWSGIL